MDKILESLENVFFKIVTLIFLIPKTLWKCICIKTFSFQTVDSELQKSEPFQDYASPIEIYLFGIIIPLYFILTTGNTEYPPAYLEWFANLSKENIFTVFAVLSLYACYWPLQQTLVSIVIEKKSAKKDIKKYFFTYLYNFSISVSGAILFGIVWVLFGVYTKVQSNSGLIVGLCIFFVVWIMTVVRGFISNIYSFQLFHSKFQKRKIYWIMIAQYFFFFIGVYSSIYFWHDRSKSG